MKEIATLEKEETKEVVVITGSSSGIGYETALRLARSGYKVYGTMRNQKRTPSLEKRAKEEGLPLEVLTLDVTRDDLVKQVFHQILQKEGRIDILINNAGIGGYGAIEEAPISLFRSVMETNYFGVIHCVQQVLPSMRKRKKGHIINVTSLAGTLASAFHSPYSASKFALESFSECLAQEMLPFNVRVSVIQPGIIATSIFDAKKTEQNSKYPTTHYPRIYRFYLNFKNGLKLKNPPGVVAKRILKVIRNPNAPFRNPSGIGASAILQGRKGQTDEQWIQWGNSSDEAWCATVDEDIAQEYRTLIQKVETS